MKLPLQTILPTLGPGRCILCVLEREEDPDALHSSCLEREQDRSFLLGCHLMMHVLIAGGMTNDDAASLVSSISAPCIRHAERLERNSESVTFACAQISANMSEINRELSRYIDKATGSS
jgi:hypothetical protein